MFLLSEQMNFGVIFNYNINNGNIVVSLSVECAYAPYAGG